MDIIQVLDPTIADQIAAGEVVNRPASVVKELLENAVDAGAKNITLVIVDAGQTLVQVIDDGKGMSQKDAIMAFKRHATSKIKSADDLWQLQTFGFRGEALASIASVSQVEMKTKREDEELGWCVNVNGGSVSVPEAVWCANGTSIVVKNLFFNTPARRKFLKSAGYERQVLILEFEKVAMANPEIGFTFKSENEAPIVYRPSSLRERVGAIIKKSINKSLIPVGLKTETITVSGWTSAPSQTGVNSTKNSHFFVNGRFMRNMLLQKSVAQAYGKLLPAGQYPFFYLFIDIDPTKIDINIHPTKTEIKFENESDVWQMVNSAVRKALGGAAVAEAIDFSNPHVEMPNYDPSVDIESVGMPKVSGSSSYNPFKSAYVPSAKVSKKEFDPEMAIFDENLTKGFYKNSAFDEMAVDFFNDGDSGFDRAEFETVNEIEMESQMGIDMQADPSHIVVFQLPGGYIATPLESGIAVIDYRRALERITADRLTSTIAENNFASQMELVPQQVNLSLAEAQSVLEIAGKLAKFGFEIGDMGQGVIAVYAMPAVISDKMDPETVINQIVEHLDKGAKIDDMFEQKIIEAVAKGVAKQKIETLSVQQMQNIVAQLLQTTQPMMTNGGSVIMCNVTIDEIEKRLKKR